MYIVQDYSLAVIFCVVTMLCWGVLSGVSVNLSV